MSAAPTVKECPVCKKQALDLLRIDTGMKVALEHVAYEGLIPAAACANCYQGLTSLISQGAKLRAQKIAKDENKKIIWRQRIDIAKKAREEMALKNYANAAVFYEKYLHSLATGFEVPPDSLVPSLFVDAKYKKELILVAYAYFDLFKIYDHNSNSNQNKFNHVRAQLKLFANLPSTRPVIVRKLRSYRGSANNKAVVEEVLKYVDKNRDSRCFIATTAFGSYQAREVQIFYAFRDDILAQFYIGQALIQWYYFVSPSIAKRLDQSPFAKGIMRFILRVVAFSLRIIFNLKSPSEL